MATNLELKVACDRAALAELQEILGRTGASDPQELEQTDTYFAATHGRLKLREIVSAEGRSTELIAYRRADERGSRWSDYQRVHIPVDQTPALVAGLEAVCGGAGVVRKRRTVIIVGQTRVHLDDVDGIGAFVELETVVAEQDQASARAEHEAVVTLLGLSRYHAVAGSYRDLVAARASATVETAEKRSEA